MKKVILILFAGTLVMASSCQRETAFASLYNGENLDNWDMYLGSSLGEAFDSLSRMATIENVFSIVQENEENIIRISGEVNGSLATRSDFENYHLRMEFRWGNIVHSRRNSGLLYHSFGEFGQAFGTWMPNIELQMMHQNLGDTYLMANTTCQTEAEFDPEKNQFFYTPGAELLNFGEQDNGRSIKKSADHENPPGEWNTVELYCHGTTSVHVINGHTVMVNQSTGVYVNGIVNPLTSGRIQIQSEGAELFIRSIEVRPIASIPGSVISRD
jgi:hypothetical protein